MLVVLVFPVKFKDFPKTGSLAQRDLGYTVVSMLM